jgi:CHAT domain-containing protein
MLAGSETLVMSLWPVSDSVARETMVAYYARLRAGFGRGDALRQAKLAILRHTSLRHPYYWGGFIQSGDWTRLPLAH